MDDLSQLKQLYKLSFDDSDEYIDNFFNTKVDFNKIIMLKRQEKIVSALHLVDKYIFLRGKSYLCPFVVAAATLPELRGHKLLESVMFSAFDKLTQNKTFFTALYPFKHSYYKKYGFITFTFVNKHFIIGDNTLGIETKKIGAQEASILLAIYNNFCKNQNGYAIRDEDTFKSLIKEWQIDDNEISLILENGEAVAYIVTGRTVEEFCGRQKYLDCIEELKGKTAEIVNGSEEYDMVRVVDPIGLLLSLNFDNDGECSFKLTDKFYPNNNGIFHLQVVDRQARVTLSENYSCEFSIEELTKLVFGIENSCGSSLNKMLRPLKTFCFDKM